MFVLSSPINLRLTPLFSVLSHQKTVGRGPEWEIGNKDEEQNGEFCCVCLRFSKLNLTPVALRSLVNRGREGKGVKGVLVLQSVCPRLIFFLYFHVLCLIWHVIERYG